jgi:hypothetical protein
MQRRYQSVSFEGALLLICMANVERFAPKFPLEELTLSLGNQQMLLERWGLGWNFVLGSPMVQRSPSQSDADLYSLFCASIWEATQVPGASVEPVRREFSILGNGDGKLWAFLLTRVPDNCIRYVIANYRRFACAFGIPLDAKVTLRGVVDDLLFGTFYHDKRGRVYLEETETWLEDAGLSYPCNDWNIEQHAVAASDLVLMDALVEDSVHWDFVDCAMIACQQSNAATINRVLDFDHFPDFHDENGNSIYHILARRLFENTLSKAEFDVIFERLHPLMTDGQNLDRQYSVEYLLRLMLGSEIEISYERKADLDDAVTKLYSLNDVD